MSHDSTLQALMERRQDLRNEAAHLEARMRGLRVEINDLDTAIKVIERMSPEHARKAETRAALDKVVADVQPTTMPEMIIQALEWAPGGLQSAAILNFIKKNFRPDVIPSQVQPTVWHMWKKGRLSRDIETGAYRLPEEKSPESAPTESSGDSQVQREPEGGEDEDAAIMDDILS